MRPVCALSTPKGVGGIGVIRVSGEGAIEICQKIINRPLADAPERTAVFCRVLDGAQTVDEILATVFRAPNSFTGEDTVELSCHGGLYVTGRVLDLLYRAGCAPAGAGEFTRRAFLNGKLDLTQAEAVIDLIEAQSKLQAQNALGRLDGALGERIEDIRTRLTAIGTDILAYVDFPDETADDIDETDLRDRLARVRDELQKLADGFETGRIIHDGIPTAIIGRPNVGKSTLLNALLGKERSIVTDLPGTTRDTVEDSAVVGELVLRLTDTAGIRETEDAVERIGVSRAKQAAAQAALVLLVTDGSVPLTGEDTDLFALCENKPTVLIRNKADRGLCAVNAPFETVCLSAKTGAGLDRLSAAIRALFLRVPPSEALVTNERQRAAVLTALAAVAEALEALDAGFTVDVIAPDLERAAESLGELTGRAVRQEMIDDIFARFCVGK